MMEALALFWAANKTRILGGLAGLLALLGAFTVGHFHGVASCEKHHAAEAHKETDKVRTEAKQEQAAIQTRYVEVKVRDLARERELQTRLDQIQAVNANLIRELNAKPDPDADVHLRLGDLRLLDDAATSGANVSADPARVAAYQSQTPTDYSLREFVGTELGLRQAYVELATRHDQLVEWVETELIHQQTADAQRVAPPHK